MPYYVVPVWTEVGSIAHVTCGGIRFKADNDEEARQKAEIIAKRAFNQKGRRFLGLTLFKKQRVGTRIVRTDIDTADVKRRLKNFRPRGRPFVAGMSLTRGL